MPIVRFDGILSAFVDLRAFLRHNVQSPAVSWSNSAEDSERRYLFISPVTTDLLLDGLRGRAIAFLALVKL